jgi:beclin 1
MERQLVEQLGSIEAERSQLQEQMEREEEKEQRLQEEEQQYFQEYNEYKRQLLEYEDAQRRLAITSHSAFYFIECDKAKIIIIRFV